MGTILSALEHQPPPQGVDRPYQGDTPPTSQRFPYDAPSFPFRSHFVWQRKSGDIPTMSFMNNGEVYTRSGRLDSLWSTICLVIAQICPLMVHWRWCLSMSRPPNAGCMWMQQLHTRGPTPSVVLRSHLPDLHHPCAGIPRPLSWRCRLLPLTSARQHSPS